MADPFLTQFIIPGIGGIDLKRAIDRVPPEKLAVMFNVQRDNEEGSLTSRAGQASFATAGSTHHVIKRLNDIDDATWTRIFAVDNQLYYGQSGALTLADTGYANEPSSMVAHRPPFSGDAWMYVGNSLRMRKIRADGTDLPIGLPPPGAAPGTSLAGKLTTTIETFNAAGWSNNQGTGAATPSNSSIGGMVGNAVQFRTAVDTLTVRTGYHNYWGKAISANLSSVGGVDATDDDLIHLYTRTSDPALLVELKVYLVCSAGFSATVIPGTLAGVNTDAYVKTFRSSDFTSLVEQQEPSVRAADRVVQREIRDDAMESYDDDRDSWEIPRAAREESRGTSFELVPGREQWSEYGVLGVPLRRGDFLRIGSDEDRDWANITGMIVVAQVARPEVITVALDDMYLHGGRGLDSVEPASQPYDYRHIHYDLRTGTKSNPSPTQADANHLDSERRGINVNPAAYGNANIRQRIYRRGGTLVDNWYYVGQNSGDGANFLDTLSDSDIITAGLLEIDNDQPVTTVNDAGTTLYAQPLPSIWGPVQGMLMGCGDKYRPGYVYHSKPEEPDHWPATNTAEVCPASEELMAGFAFGNQAYVFSREKLYPLYPNLSRTAGVSSGSSVCDHGLINRWAFAVGSGRIWFVSKDGVYWTAGGAETSITDDDIRGLFHGETRNGYTPINFNQINFIKLEIHANDLYFSYINTDGLQMTMVYSIPFNYWRPYVFTRPVACFYSEEASGRSTLLMGGLSTGASYTNTGTTDDGDEFECRANTGALDQGLLRQNKLYGDLVIDLDRDSATVEVQCHLNGKTQTLAPQVVTTETGRYQYYLELDVANTGPVLARNLAVDVSWETPQQPRFYFLGISYTPQPDTTIKRVTNWDVTGRPADKYVKGIIIECDTFGEEKLLELQADGVTQQRIRVIADGRKVLHFSFPQFQGRILRIWPADKYEWMIYDMRWIFDEEPLALKRWETQDVDHGIQGWQTPLYAYITYRSIEAVTLSMAFHKQDGTTSVETYELPATEGFKRKRYVPFHAAKGFFFKYTFTSIEPFWLYREETQVVIQPWGAPKAIVSHPFGNDNLDLVGDVSAASVP
jgi:hypothetical protein